MATINIIAPLTSAGIGGNNIPVADLLRRLDNLMSDEDKIRWSIPERLDWFNDAASEIVTRRPASRAVTETITLAAGTLQVGPEGTAQVMDVVRNINPDGSAGRAIRMTDRQQMDDCDPEWHSATPSRSLHFMIDERSPTSFYVYPPAIPGAKVEVLVSKPPPKVMDADDAIDMRAEFINAILNWALYRCHTKDSEFAQGAVAAQHYQAFTDAIGAPGAAAVQNSASANNI